MPNKTRLEEQSSPEPINALNNNKHIIQIIFLNNELQSVVQSSSFDKLDYLFGHTLLSMLHCCQTKYIRNIIFNIWLIDGSDT